MKPRRRKQNRSIATSKAETIIKFLSSKESSGLGVFTAMFHETFKYELMLFFKLLQKIKRELQCWKSSSEASIVPYKSCKGTKEKKYCRPISSVNTNTNFSVKFLQVKFKNTSRRWYTMAKWASFQGWRVSSKCTIQ